MNVVINNDDTVTIVCNREELDMLDNGLSWFISESDVGHPFPDVVLAKQMMTDIANLEFTR
jgi:hypothetical protein